jgi:hypothetical protein
MKERSSGKDCSLAGARDLFGALLGALSIPATSAMEDPGTLAVVHVVYALGSHLD